MKYFRFFTILLPVAVFVLVLLQSIVSNELAGAGKNSLSLDKSIESLRSENELLRRQLATQTSLATVEIKARDLGFGYFAGTVALTAPDVAYNRAQ